MELSAMLVERITFLNPTGGTAKTLCCSSCVIEEWRGYNIHLCSIKRQNQSQKTNLIQSQNQRLLAKLYGKSL